MATDSQYEQELEAEEKKHKKILKYDLELFVILIIFIIFVTIVNLILRADYKVVAGMKPTLAPTLVECNKSILNAAETFRKNATDVQARAAVDAAKLSFDSAILYYGRTIQKGTPDGVVLNVFDSCYMVALRFRSVLESQQHLAEYGVTPEMIAVMDNDINALRGKLDTLTAKVEVYNSSGFFLKFSWLTPYPGTIEHDRVALPELQPVIVAAPQDSLGAK